MSECHISFILPGAAHRLIQEGSPEPEVKAAAYAAAVKRHGLGYRATITCPVSTADLMADYLWSIEGAVSRMTAAERDGGREVSVAAKGVAIIETAVQTHECQK
jgi:hypothetical protein